jgi:hypothetical protein
MAASPKTEITCANCSTTSGQAERASNEATGAPDLDLRPASERRHTMDRWLHECPTCKLICPNLASPPQGAAAVLMQPEYLALAADKKVPDSVRKFRAWAYLAEKTGLDDDAGFAHLHAAWVADDARNKDLADLQRHMAVTKLAAARDKKMVYPRQRGGAEALLADIHRRSGNWDEAVHEAERGKSITDQEFVAALCDLKISLAQRHDAGAHTTDDVK